MESVRCGSFQYTVEESWGRLPEGFELGEVSSVAITEDQRVVLLHRGQSPVLIFSDSGELLDSWGDDSLRDPHSVTIDPSGTFWITDRSHHTVLAFTEQGVLIREIGTRGVPSDTGADVDGGDVLRSAGPFNRPTKLAVAPGGDLYVSDGYRNARVHRFGPAGVLLASWGTYGHTAPLEFHLPHSVLVDRDSFVYVCDRENSRIQILTADGEYKGAWTDLYRPTDICQSDDGLFYISELMPRLSIRDQAGEPIATCPAPTSFHGIAVNRAGDVFLALVRGHRLTRYRKV